jgi:hypothetical protein
MITWIQDSPLYTSVDASQVTFLLYKGGMLHVFQSYLFSFYSIGIYQDPSCSSTVIGRKVIIQILKYKSNILLYL